jgi:flagellar basal-body rod protein FlgF
VFALEATAGYLDKTGPAIRTDSPTDAMTSTNSWFTVQGADGNEAYTRNGHFEVASDGTLVTAGGLQVLSNGGAPITVPAGAQISVGHDGNISAKVGNQPGNNIGRLKLVTATGDDPLKRGDDGLFRTLSGDPLNNDDTARLHVGELEGSNVNPIETMVGMIQTARQFEAQMRLLQTAESNDRSAGQLLGLQG